MKYLLLLFAPLAAQILPIRSMNEASEHLAGANEQTLIIFDVDQVLIIPRPPIFQPQNRVLYRPLFNKLIANLTHDQHTLAGSFVISNVGATLVEPDTPALIRSLQQRGIPCIALTAAISSSCAGWGDRRHDRHISLREQGIEFSMRDIADFDLPSLPGLGGRHAVYSRGVLYTNGDLSSKGEVLRAFLLATGIWPEKVLFFDDRRDNVESVEEHMERLGIPHTSFHYRAVDTLDQETFSEQEVIDAWGPMIRQAIEADQICPLR
jgi:Protein of unknown function (DUF2608)